MTSKRLAAGAGGGVHRRLREHGARRERDVGRKCAVEGLPREGELLQRSERDTDDDGEQRRVHLPLEYSAEDNVR